MSKKDDEVKNAGTAVAAAANTAVGAVLDFSADAGLGTEGADKDSFAIPFLSILQPLSPQVADGKDGFKAGLFVNSVTEELSSEVLLVPVAFQRRYLRWAPREKGGGYKGEFQPSAVETGAVEGLVKGDDNRYYIGGSNPKEHDSLKDTRNHFVLVVRPDGSWNQALISMSSTQIKKSKRWLSRIQGVMMKDAAGRAFNPPSFSHIYKAKSLKESNDQGIWYGWEIEMVGPVQDADLYAAAKAFHKQIAEGKVDIAPPMNEEHASSGDDQF